MKTMLFFSVLLAVSLAQAGKVEILVKLSPAGTFRAVTEQVKGSVKKSGDQVIASDIQVQVGTFKTGIELRDKHFLERLESKKFPIASLVKAQGSGGNGKAKIKVKGIEKDVEGTYEIDGKKFVGKFNVKISDFGITGVKYMGVGVKEEAEVTVEVPIQ